MLHRGEKTELGFKFRSPNSWVSAPYERCYRIYYFFPFSLYINRLIYMSTFPTTLFLEDFSLPK